MSILPRFNNQDLTLAKMKTTPIMLDSSDPGTGKTRCQLDAIDKGSGKPALVIAPKNLLRAAWYDDCQKFTPHLRCSLAYAHNRAKAFETPADIYITNTDAVSWLAKQSSSFFDKFDRLIIDESSAFKNPNSARSKAAVQIAPYFDYRYELTGTPNPNDITDIWNQIYILDEGERLGKLFYGFRNAVCDAIPIRGAHVSPYAKKYIMKPGMDTTVAQLISDINIRHLLEECHDIPKNRIRPLRYDMNNKAKKEYDQLKKTAILQLSTGEYVLGTNAAVLLGKLQQACSGSIYSVSGQPANIDNQRTGIVADLVEERSHSVVFFQWTHQRDALIQAFKKRKITYCLVDGSVSQTQRDKAIKHFQAGLYRVFLAHPASTAHGLTLTRAVANIWASLGWNLEHFIQGNRRVYRAGQDKKTETIVIIANNTVEEDVYQRLKKKEKVQASILEVLKLLS